MYREDRWDAERKMLWFKSTPNGEWVAATMLQTIEWLAERVAYLEALFEENVS